MGMTESMMIEKCRTNDPEGFRVLMQAYGPLVYLTCFYYTQSRGDTLDLMQETWLKVFRGIHTFDTCHPLTTWLRRIASNACVTFLRKRAAPSLSLQRISEETDSTLEDRLTDPQQVEDRVLLAETCQTLNQALLLLPEKMRTAIQLRHGEGLTYEKIAWEMQEPLGSVKTLLHRGRKTLWDTLLRQESGEGLENNVKEGVKRKQLPPHTAVCRKNGPKVISMIPFPLPNASCTKAILSNVPIAVTISQSFDSFLKDWRMRRPR